MSGPLVGVVMGSRSDWEVMEHAIETLKALEIAHEVRVLSAHRTPDALDSFLNDTEGSGVQVFIAAAGGAAHLAGVVAAHTTIPVLGVPITSALLGLDSLLSTAQMPGGIPVATFAIGKAGATNAGLFAISILANSRPELKEKLRAFRVEQAEKVKAAKLP